nr:hypothetical protein [Pandoravirus massiliensis]
MPYAPESRRQAIDMVERTGLFWSCLARFCPSLLGIAAGVHGNPQGHPFVHAAAFSLGFVQTAFCIVLLFVFLLYMHAVGVGGRRARRHVRLPVLFLSVECAQETDNKRVAKQKTKKGQQ